MIEKVCNICSKNRTDISAEVIPGSGIEVHVCEECLDRGKREFIFLCMSCGKSYFRNKEMMIGRIKDINLKRAYMQCKEDVIIQGIDMCIECNPGEIVNYMMAHGSVGGHS